MMKFVPQTVQWERNSRMWICSSFFCSFKFYQSSRW